MPALATSTNIQSTVTSRDLIRRPTPLTDLVRSRAPNSPVTELVAEFHRLTDEWDATPLSDEDSDVMHDRVIKLERRIHRTKAASIVDVAAKLSLFERQACSSPGDDVADDAVFAACRDLSVMLAGR